MSRFFVAAALVHLSACSCGSAESEPVDASGPELPAWDRGLPEAGDAFGVRRGLTPARGIIHLHSPFSHDACDGEPRDEQTGAIDESCLQDQRAALCELRIDYAVLTEHDDSMADEEFVDLFHNRAGDEPILGSGGLPLASRINCDNGHSVLLYVGGENPLMPIMIEAHPPGTIGERHDFYNANGPAAVAAFRSVGGLVVVPHTEGRQLAELEALAPDGIEIYNLHANIDADIRRDDLGLDPSAAIRSIGDFADTRPEAPEPDLALIAFVERFDVTLDRWDALLGQGRRVFGTGGTDAHQNALPIALRDGERADSYRRMMRWFANVALVADPSDPAQVKQAVAAGQFFVAFELFGTPAGFDVHADGPGGIVEMGGEVGAGDGYELRVSVPELFGQEDALPAPVIRARVIRASASGAEEIGDGAGPLTVPMDAAGAYRVEVMITPKQLGPYLGLRGTADSDRERVWIYSNPIYVVP